MAEVKSGRAARDGRAGSGRRGSGRRGGASCAGPAGCDPRCEMVSYTAVCWTEATLAVCHLTARGAAHRQGLVGLLLTRRRATAAERAERRRHCAVPLAGAHLARLRFLRSAVRVPVPVTLSLPGRRCCPRRGHRRCWAWDQRIRVFAR
jgi:hypothetical protein